LTARSLGTGADSVVLDGVAGFRFDAA